MGKIEELAFYLLEEMVANNYQWLMERPKGRKSQGIHEIDDLTLVNAKVNSFAKRLDKIKMHNGLPSSTIICKICGGGHEIIEAK